LVEAGLDAEAFADDGDQHVHRDGDPDSGANGIGAGAVERFDPQVLLDPSKEQFYPPSLLVELCDVQRWLGGVVDQKIQPLVVFRVVVDDAAQRGYCTVKVTEPTAALTKPEVPVTVTV
jgi:hypothetical protein